MPDNFISSNGKVKYNVTDPNPGYLYDKINTGTFDTFTVSSISANSETFKDPTNLLGVKISSSVLSANRIQTLQNKDGILALTTDVKPASAISFSAIGGLSSTNVQSALEELDIEKAKAIETKTVNFTAELGGRYIVESGGVVGIVDPAGTVLGQSYEVWIGSGTVRFGATSTMIQGQSYVIISGTGHTTYGAANNNVGTVFVANSNATNGTGLVTLSTNIAYTASRFSIRRRYNSSAWVTPSPVITDSLTVGSNSWDGSTITGAQAFSSTTRPTSSATTATTPANDSLVTLADYQMESRLDKHRLAMRFPTSLLPVLGGSGGTSAIYGNGATLTLATGAAAGSYRFGNFGWLILHSSSSGTNFNFNKQFIASGTFTGANLTPELNYRFLVGVANSYTTNVDAFTNNGIGIEIMTISGVMKIRLIYFAGTYKQSAWYDITSSNFFTLTNSFILINRGSGTYDFYLKQFYDLANSSDIKVSTTTPLITITDGPTGIVAFPTYKASIGTTATDVVASPGNTLLVQNFLFERFT